LRDATGQLTGHSGAARFTFTDSDEPSGAGVTRATLEICAVTALVRNTASATLQVILAIFGKKGHFGGMQAAPRPGFSGESVVEQKCDVMAGSV
jgi:hypothetical protein